MDTSCRDLLLGLKKQRHKGFAILVDPDKVSESQLLRMTDQASAHGATCILVGGSLVQDTYIQQLVPLLKAHTPLPVILFPGSIQQVVPAADALFFLSLISGRNPDLLIGRHVEAVPLLRSSNLEVIPTGYLLVDGGKLTTAHYVSNTLPIPHDKHEIAVTTALAGQYLGMQVIYLDAGSGALHPVSSRMIQAVSQEITLPLVVGGGIRTEADAASAWQAGADLIVIGSVLEQEADPRGGMIASLGKLARSLSPTTINIP